GKYLKKGSSRKPRVYNNIFTLKRQKERIAKAKYLLLLEFFLEIKSNILVIIPCIIPNSTNKSNHENQPSKLKFAVLFGYTKYTHMILYYLRICLAITTFWISVVPSPI